MHANPSANPLIDMETTKLKLLVNAMQAYTWRAQAVTSNIANLDTPDYRRLSVTFEQSLQEARNGLDGADRLAEIRPEVEMADVPPVLEDELMELADTQMRAQLVSRALREHYETMRMGISGRTA